MNILSVFIISILLCVIFLLFVNNKKIILEHKKNIANLNEIIASLSHKQNHLNNQVVVSEIYKNNYQKNVKSIGEEIVKLQKVFLEGVYIKKP